MTSYLLLSTFALYTLLIFIVTWITSRRSNNATYFIGNKSSPWYIVAYGMIGASLSGVTFMSVPGEVGVKQFSYMIIVFGYLVGYFVIATVLLPLYYKLNLTSIYTYLGQRFGFFAYKTGSFYFILSRVVGAAFRMYLVANVLQIFVFDNFGFPFWLTVVIFIILIILYTFEGGVKTIVWTDTLQTTFMLAAVGITIYLISSELNLGLTDLLSRVWNSDYSKMVFTDWHDKKFFVKQFVSGAFIAIVMTGLDQEMMQKNLSCKSLRDAQKNMFTFSFVLVFVNFMFLMLGAVLYIFASTKGIAIPEKTDDLFPYLAINHLGTFASLVFIVGLISAAYPSADGALTALTTSFCFDFLSLQNTKYDEKARKKIRYVVHLSFALILLLVIVVFHAINDQAVISKLFTVAGYTYGPLLGLYAFGLFTKLSVRDRFVPIICIIAPILCYILSSNSESWFNGYKFGFELLILNGILTFCGLFFLSIKHDKHQSS